LDYPASSKLLEAGGLEQTRSPISSTPDKYTAA